MCGIHAVISSTSQVHDLELERRLRNRGPDHLGTVEARLEPGPAVLTFTSTVLALRGGHLTKQPFHDSQAGSVLCWNGEAWKIGGRLVEGNDGEALFGLLTKASASSLSSSPAPSPHDIRGPLLQVLRSIEGPFAFVYFDKPTRTLFFGRDRLGRRSLTTYCDDTMSSIILSSIAETSDPAWKEVEADGIYTIDMGSLPTNDHLTVLLPIRHDWQVAGTADMMSGIGVFNMSLPHQASAALTSSSLAVGSLKQQLLDSLSLRVRNIPQPPVATASSGDTRVAVLFSGGLDCTVLARLAIDLVDTSQDIDLLNVAFENPRVAAQLAKQANGGPIDPYEACPDRITGRKSFAELQATCPGSARFRFVAVNVPFSETTAHRDQVISLIHPHDTEMDLSIAFALYFAARGKGVCSQPGLPDAASYTTPARVLLSGLGADELFGGYVRHATAFSRRGYPGLLDELELDVGRLGKRNLGRDDRAMAHWGKEVRFPFLDEQLVRWAIEAPVWEKCDFSNGEEISGVEPGKRVLRLVAQALGMQGVATEKKRAVSLLHSTTNGCIVVGLTLEDPIRVKNSQNGERSGQRHHEDIVRVSWERYRRWSTERCRGTQGDARLHSDLGGDDIQQILLSREDARHKDARLLCSSGGSPSQPLIW